MAKITAAGLYGGEYYRIECEGEDGNYSLRFNGGEDPGMEAVLRIFLAGEYPIGGSYYPPKDSMLQVYGILSEHFFEMAHPYVKIEGDIGTVPPVGGSPRQDY